MVRKLEESTIVNDTTSTEEIELLEDILAELQKMNEEEVIEVPGTEIEEVYTEFQQAVIENQQVDNSISLGVFGMLLFLIGILLAKVTFRRL